MFSLIALALATAVVAVPLAEASPGTSTRTNVDPLAVSTLLGKGLSQGEIRSWTVGACSHAAKSPSCYAMIGAAAEKSVDPLAVSYLAGQGLTASEITSWTTGDCSHQFKATACYAMFEPAAAAATASIGFRWSDAAIGAGATLGLVLLLGGLTAAFVTRHHGADRTAHA